MEVERHPRYGLVTSSTTAKSAQKEDPLLGMVGKVFKRKPLEWHGP